MSFQEFLLKIGLNTTSFWGIVIFLMSIGIEIIPKIKWSPWSALFKYIGSRFNDRIDKKVSEIHSEVKALDKKITQVNSKLQTHVDESEIKTMQDLRWSILDFANSCMNKRKHTREQFEFVIKQCDEYEIRLAAYNAKHDIKDRIKNGVAESAIKDIKRINDECRQNGTYLK